MKAFFNYYFATKEEIEKEEEIIDYPELKKKFLEHIENMKSVKFGERHHPWIRHIKIELRYSDDSDMNLYIYFQGIVTNFDAICILMTEKLLSTEFTSQESLEDYLERVFLNSHYLRPNYLMRDTRKFDDYAEKCRNNVYLDYKFYKALLKEKV